MCIRDSKDSKLYFVSLDEDPIVEFGYMSQRQKVEEVLQPAEFIEVKGWKALGNKLVDKKLISIREQPKAEEKEEEPDDEDTSAPTGGKGAIQADLFGPPAKKVPNDKKGDKPKACLLYTSDAADERSSVDLGGRSIITKKKRVVYGQHGNTTKRGEETR